MVEFSDFPVPESVGIMLAHSLTTATGRYRKGQVLSARDVADLQAAGVVRVSGARLGPEDVAENPAAQSVAEFLCGKNLSLRQARGGRCNLHAEVAGVLTVDAERIIAANLVNESIAIGTLPPWSVTRPGQVVATVKIIPCGVRRDLLAACRQRLEASGTPPLNVAPWRPYRAGLIVTTLPGQRAKSSPPIRLAMQQRLAVLGSTLVFEASCAHATTQIAAALLRAKSQGCELILISGAAGTKDRRDTVPGGVTAAGGRIERFGLPVEPGNMLLMAWLDEVPVLVLPGCARSQRLNGVDWVLQRLHAGLPPGEREWAAMGVGGLIRSSPGPFPDWPRGEGDHSDHSGNTDAGDE